MLLHCLWDQTNQINKIASTDLIIRIKSIHFIPFDVDVDVDAELIIINWEIKMTKTNKMNEEQEYQMLI